MKRIKLCKEDGCRQLVRAKGLCIAHYSSLRYTKTRPHPCKPPKKPRPVKYCSKDRCGNVAHAKGLCKCHYNHTFGYDKVKKRKKINQVSSKRRAWNDKYYAQVEKDAAMQAPVDQPDKLYGKDNHYKIQRHHPFRRLGEAILAYVYCTREAHERWEHNSSKAREDGWIWTDKSPEEHLNRPWPASAEASWPDKFKRPID